MAKKKTGLGTGAFFQTIGQRDSKPVDRAFFPEPDEEVGQSRNRAARKPAKQSSLNLAASPGQDKVKATYYLSSDTLGELAAAPRRLQKLVENILTRDNSPLVAAALQIVLDDLEAHGPDSAIAKSLLVEAALQVVLDDLETNGADSAIARKLMGL